MTDSERILELEETLRIARQALKHTRDYVGHAVLPEVDGWSWFDAVTLIDKTLRPKEPRSLRQIVCEGIGTGSLCWENPGGAGEFDTSEAIRVCDTVVGEIIPILYDAYENMQMVLGGFNRKLGDYEDNQVYGIGGFLKKYHESRRKLAELLGNDVPTDAQEQEVV